MGEKDPSLNNSDDIKENRDSRGSNNVGDAFNDALEEKGIDPEIYKNSLSDKKDLDSKPDEETDASNLESNPEEKDNEKKDDEKPNISYRGRQGKIDNLATEEESRQKKLQEEKIITPKMADELGMFDSDKFVPSKEAHKNQIKKNRADLKKEDRNKEKKEVKVSKKEREVAKIKKTTKEILELFNSDDKDKKIYEHKAIGMAENIGLLKAKDGIAFPVDEYKELGRSFLKAINMTEERQREYVKKEREEKTKEKLKKSVSEKVVDKQIGKTEKWMKEASKLEQIPLTKKLDNINSALGDIKPGCVNVNNLQKMVGTNEFARRVNRFKKEGHFTIDKNGEITSIDGEKGRDDINSFLSEAKKSLIFERAKRYSTDQQLKKAYDRNTSNVEIGSIARNKEVEDAFIALLDRGDISIDNKGKITPVNDEGKEALEAIRSSVEQIVEDRYYEKERGSKEGSVKIEHAVNEKIRESEVGKKMIEYMSKKQDEITKLKPRTFMERIKLLFNREKMSKYRKDQSDLARMEREYRYWHRNEQRYLDGVMEFQMRAREIFGEAGENDIGPEDLSSLKRELHELMLQKRFIAKNNIKRINDLGNFKIPEEALVLKEHGIDYAKFLSEEEEKVKSELIERIDFENTSLVNRWLGLSNIPEERRDEFLKEQTGYSIKRWSEEELRKRLLKNSLDSLFFDPKSFNSERMIDLFDQLQQSQLDSRRARMLVQREINVTITRMFFADMYRDARVGLKQLMAHFTNSEMEVEIDTRIRNILENGNDRLSRLYQSGERAVEGIQWGFYAGSAELAGGLGTFSELGLQNPLRAVGLRFARLEKNQMHLDDINASLWERANVSGAILDRLDNIRTGVSRNEYLRRLEEERRRRQERRRREDWQRAEAMYQFQRATEEGERIRERTGETLENLGGRRREERRNRTRDEE